MVRRTPIALTLILALAAIPMFSGCGDSSSSTPPSVRHLIIYQPQGVWRGILIVNGIPVQLLNNPQGGPVSITEWVQSGANEVAIIAQCDDFTQVPFQFQVFSYTMADASDAKPLGNPVGIAPPAGGSAESAAAVASFQAPPRDPWPWEKATVLTGPPSDQDTIEINAVFKQFCDAFTNKNVDSVLNVLSTGTSIKHRTLGITQEQARNNDAEMLKKIFAESGGVYTIKPELAQLRPFARGVMISPQQIDGSMHLLTIENKVDVAKSNVFDFMTLCKIDGKWVRVN